MRVDHRQVDAVLVGDPAPVGDGGTAERVGADAHAGGADGVQVQDAGQIGDVRAEEVVPLGGVRGERAGVRQAAHVLEAARDDLVGAVLDPGGGVGGRRAAARRVVLEAAVGGRVVRRGDDYAVGEARGAAPVVGQDRVRDGGRGRVAVRAVDEDGHLVGGENLQRGGLGRLGQGVGVGAQEEGPVGALGGPVLADGLAGGGDVVLVEGARQGRAAVARGAERHPLSRVGRVGVQRVVRRDQPGHVDKVLGTGRPAGALVRHESVPPLRSGRSLTAHLSSPGACRASAPHQRRRAPW